MAFSKPFHLSWNGSSCWKRKKQNGGWLDEVIFSSMSCRLRREAGRPFRDCHLSWLPQGHQSWAWECSFRKLNQAKSRTYGYFLWNGIAQGEGNKQISLSRGWFISVASTSHPTLSEGKENLRLVLLLFAFWRQWRCHLVTDNNVSEREAQICASHNIRL